MAVLSRLDILLHADTARATQDIRQFSTSTASAFDSIRQNAVDMGGKIKTGIGVFWILVVSCGRLLHTVILLVK